MRSPGWTVVCSAWAPTRVAVRGAGVWVSSTSIAVMSTLARSFCRRNPAMAST